MCREADLLRIKLRKRLKRERPDPLSVPDPPNQVWAMPRPIADCKAICRNGFYGRPVVEREIVQDALAVDVAFQLLVAQLYFHLCGPISRVRPHAGTGVALRQQMVHRLAIVLGCVHCPAGHCAAG